MSPVYTVFWLDYFGVKVHNFHYSTFAFISGLLGYINPHLRSNLVWYGWTSGLLIFLLGVISGLPRLTKRCEVFSGSNNPEAFTRKSSTFSLKNIYLPVIKKLIFIQENRSYELMINGCHINKTRGPEKLVSIIWFV